MDKARMRRTAAAILLLALGGIAACTDQEAVREEQLGELLAWLPGKYNNATQAAQDVQQNLHPVHEAITLLIMPVHAPRLGHHVFFVEEISADDPRHVVSERMFSYDTDEKKGIVGLTWNFTDPRRWLEGRQNPALFAGLVVEDVDVSGCELQWKKSGERFLGSYDPKRCHTAKGTGADDNELTPDTLTLAGFKFKRIP
jgi:CpeT/CpcT family (DUF1001)